MGDTKDIGQYALRYETIFERVAGARRSLGAVRDDPPLRIWRTREIR